ncbi:MAG: formate--tetrahydrofolate ligase [Alphaproteobacteria bacterium]|nr:formate--tetrahydrofolate ligase [Alphaproteobacteria bacterium]
MSAQKPDIEIARAATVRPIAEIGAALGIPADALHQYGPLKAKIGLDYLETLAERPRGKLVLVTAITPTPAGEGKTTTTVGLGDGLNRIGKKAAICIREPSLGPCFGIKGGAAGGGHAQVVPMEDINLHFTGDLHAIGAAHNLMSALIDNHIHWGNDLAIDARRIDWRRVLDINDRALRHTVVSLGGPPNGFPRETGFDITVASEVMAIFCLATSMADLERRLGNIVIGSTAEGAAVTVHDLSGDGAMAVLLKDALMPNLVQTLENNPAFVHGGPFANIAHGCNSVIATDAALRLSDYVVTEAGFGADLGAEKFFDIKCRKAGLEPDAVVVVATVRALKMHGGVALADLAGENVDAVAKGLDNLRRHIANVEKFGVPVVVAINRFTGDSDAEVAVIGREIAKDDVEVIECTHWSDGSAGIEELSHKVVELADSGKAAFAPLYGDGAGLFEKINIVSREIYGASEAIADKAVRDRLRQWEGEGYGHFPVCMAKTQYSFSTDPNLKGAPSDHVVPVREVRLSAGAEFVVAICGQIMTLPGLPKVPAANYIGLDENGLVEGLF